MMNVVRDSGDSPKPLVDDLAVAEMIRIGDAESPREACGLLTGVALTRVAHHHQPTHLRSFWWGSHGGPSDSTKLSTHPAYPAQSTHPSHTIVEQVSNTLHPRVIHLPNRAGDMKAVSGSGKSEGMDPCLSYLVTARDCLDFLMPHEWDDPRCIGGVLIWHTHPSGRCGPSAGDLAARIEGVDYLVVSFPPLRDAPANASLDAPFVARF